MNKTNEQLIADFKKANKERRLKIAEKAGYSNTEDYLLSLASPVKTKKAKKAKEIVDYVVAFDTTGSMAGYIGNVKKHVTSLIPQMFSQGIDLKMKIVAFGDYCDMRSEREFGKAYQQSEFTDSENKLIKFVTNAENTSGGDGDEFYELVIKKITEETPWRKNSRRAVLFIADCDPHSVNYVWFNKKRGIDWRQEAGKASKLGISFDTLSIHGTQYPWYQELSKITGGVYMPFSSQEKMTEVFTASLYVRGSEMSKASFTSSYSKAEASGDTELIGTYKSLSTLL